MDKNNPPSPDEISNILATIKKNRIKGIDRVTKGRIAWSIVFLLLSISGLNLIYDKVSDSKFDIQFYLILAGVIFSLNVITGSIGKLRPSYIKNLKKQIYDGP